jgi:hypothetical protein
MTQESFLKVLLRRNLQRHGAHLKRARQGKATAATLQMTTDDIEKGADSVIEFWAWAQKLADEEFEERHRESPPPKECAGLANAMTAVDADVPTITGMRRW